MYLSANIQQIRNYVSHLEQERRVAEDLADYLCEWRKHAIDLGENEFGSDLFTLPTSVIVYDTKGGNQPFYISENPSVLTNQSGIGDTVLVAQGKRGGVKCMIVIKE